MSSSVNEPSFRESVEIMYNRAVKLMDLPDGLKEKIRVCVMRHIPCVSVSVCAVIFTRSRVTVRCIPNIWSLLRAAFVIHWM